MADIELERERRRLYVEHMKALRQSGKWDELALEYRERHPNGDGSLQITPEEEFEIRSDIKNRLRALAPVIFAAWERKQKSGGN
jgi:hypothetical protein